MDYRIVLMVIALFALAPALSIATSCTNNWVGGSCSGSVVYNTNVILTNAINVSGSILVNPAVTLTSNGYWIVAGGTFTNNGVVLTNTIPNSGGASVSGNPTPGNNGNSLLNSFGGSGGGGGGCGSNSAGGSGGNGGTTDGSVTGTGGACTTGAGQDGVGGSNAIAPVITNANIRIYVTGSSANAVYNGNFIIYFSGGAGGSGGSNGGNPSGAGGNGAYGAYIQAQNIYNLGTVNSQGGTGGNGNSSAAGGGGGGSGLVLFSYNSICSGCGNGGGAGDNTISAGGFNGIGGTGGNPGGAGGIGGSGNAGGIRANGALSYQWTTPPIPPSLNNIPTLSISPNPSQYGQSATVTATCPNGGDSCAVVLGTIGNTPIATGTGSATYNTNSLLDIGTYQFSANDITLNTNSVLTTFTVAKANTILTISQCSNTQYPLGCTTTFSIYSVANAVTANAFLNGINIGSYTNTLTDTQSNAINQYCYTANTLGNADYNPNSISINCWNIYVPITLQTWNSLVTIAPPGNTIGQNALFYPIKLYTNSPDSSITYTLKQVKPSSNVIANNVADISYVPPPTQAMNLYQFNGIETEYGNSITMTFTANQLNMTDVTNALTTNSPIIQYFPNQAYLPVNAFTATPQTWKLWSSPTSMTHTNVSNTVWFTSDNTLLPVNILLSYSFTSFNISFTNNLAVQTSLTLNAFNYALSNTIPGGFTTRQVAAVNTFDERNFAKLITNTTIITTALFNNFTISNQIATSGSNSFSLWMSSSNYNNPIISYLSFESTSSAPSHFLVINNFCPTNINSSSWASYNIYLPDPNASLYTFNIYRGLTAGAIGYYLRIMDGVNNASAKAVQQYKIAANPFALPLQNGASYSFRFLNSNCGLVYATNYTIWGNPISITLPFNNTAPQVTIPNVTANCNLVYNSVNTYSTLTCTGSDQKNMVSAWNISVYNASTLAGYRIITSNTIAGSSFSYSYHPLSNVSVIHVLVTAKIGSSNGAQFTFPFTFNNLVSHGFSTPADGFITLLFMLGGIGLGKMTTSGGTPTHTISVTLWLEAFMLALTWLVGLTAFIPWVFISVVCTMLIIVGIMLQKKEATGIYGA